VTQGTHETKRHVGEEKSNAVGSGVLMPMLDGALRILRLMSFEGFVFAMRQPNVNSAMERLPDYLEIVKQHQPLFSGHGAVTKLFDQR
jgi:hypothetical protein